MNTVWIDVKYANLIGPRLDQFKVKKTSPFLANFRCPICGDSQKNKYKARGYFFQKPTHVIMTCHNCGESTTLLNFIRRLDPTMHDEFKMELYKAKYENSPNPPKEKVIVETQKYTEKSSPLKKLKKISDLPSGHIAREYLEHRLIPSIWFSRMFYCDNFSEWTNSMLPDKLDTKFKEARIIIPFLDTEDRMFGYQGRSLNPDEADHKRYVSIMLTDQTKLFGMDHVNVNKKIYVLEGAFDSMFLPNAVATLQGDLLAVKEVLGQRDYVFIPDGDVRNKEIMKTTRKLVERGENVCMLPESFPGKDLNDAIKNGVQLEKLQAIVDANTFSGLEARMHFSSWCKVDINPGRARVGT
jgi:hypothetical protein